MRRSRSDFVAVSTAFLAASSHEFLLVPTTSMTRYTLSVVPFAAMAGAPWSGVSLDPGRLGSDILRHPACLGSYFPCAGPRRGAAGGVFSDRASNRNEG